MITISDISNLKIVELTLFKCLKCITQIVDIAGFTGRDVKPISLRKKVPLANAKQLSINKIYGFGEIILLMLMKLA